MGTKINKKKLNFIKKTFPHFDVLLLIPYLRVVFLFSVICLSSFIRFECDGKHNCSINVARTVFEDNCPATPKYLSVTNDCRLGKVHPRGMKKHHATNQIKYSRKFLIWWGHRVKRSPSGYFVSLNRFIFIQMFY